MGQYTKHGFPRATRVTLLASLDCDMAWDDFRYVSRLFGVNYPALDDYRKQHLHKFIEHHERLEPMTEQEMVAELAAKTAHEVNRAYCAGLGDASQPPWETAPDWQRASCVKGVYGVLAGNTHEQSHAGWLAQKVSDGWTYGAEKDPAKKTHPCMLPYAELPAAQRFKDTLFVTAVRGVLAHHGLMAP